jgi:hypothetical protein
LISYTDTGFKAVNKAGDILKDVKVDITKYDYIAQVAE